jgi:hypothetical protein
MMVAAVEELVSQVMETAEGFPDVTIYIARNLHPVFENHPLMFTLRVPPIPDGEMMRYDHIFDCSDYCARYESAVQPNIDKNRPQIWVEGNGYTWHKRAPRIYLTAEERAFAKDYLKDFPRPIVGVGYKSVERWRDYPYMNLLIQALSKEYPTILVFHDKAIHVKFSENVHLIVGARLRKLFALVGECAVVVAPDTAHVHIAGALGVPVFGLFGPTDGNIRLMDYGVPFGLPRKFTVCGRQPCWYSPCKGRWCLSTLSPSKVVAGVKALMQRSRIA